jgi:hypothetical protein
MDELICRRIRLLIFLAVHYCDACHRLLETSITLLFGVISFADEVAPSESMNIELLVHCSINAR